MANIGDLLLRVLADMAGFETDVITGAEKAGDKAGAAAGQKLSKGLVSKTTAAFTAAGAAGGALFAGAIGGAANFEDQLRTINTVAHLTDEELDGVGKSILDLSKETGKSTDDLTAGFYDLVSAGVPANDAIAVLKDSAVLATGALGTTAETVDLLTSAINAYGLEARDSAKIADIFAQAVADGKVTAAELGTSIANIAPIAAQAGVKLEEVAAGYAVLTAKGVPAAQAATQMRAAISALLTPNAQLNELQKETGKNFAELARQKGLVVALNELRDATNGNDEAFAKALGSIEAYNFAVSTTGEESAAFATELDKVTDAAEKGGVAQGQYEERMKSSVQQAKKLVAGIRATALEIGGPFTDSLGTAVIALNELGGGMGGIVNLSRLFGGAFGGLAGAITSKVGPKLKSGLQKALVKAFGGLIIPSRAFEGALETGLSDAVGPAVKKAGLAGKIAKAVGTIAIPVTIAFMLAEFLEQHHEDSIKPEIARIVEEGLTSGTEEGIQRSIDTLNRIANTAGKHDPWLAEYIRTQLPALEQALGEANGSVARATAQLPGQAADQIDRNAPKATAAVSRMVSNMATASKDDAHRGGELVAGQWIRGFYNGVIENQSLVKTAVETAMNLGETIMDKHTEAMYLIGVLMSDEMAQGVHDKRPQVAAAWQAARDAAMDRLKDIGVTSYNVGKEGMKMLGDGAKSKKPYIKDTAGDIKRILEQNVKPNTKPAGRAAGQGVIDGLNSKKGAVYASAVAFAASLLAGIQNKLRIAAGRGPQEFASGGDIAAYQPSIVGERRPELFVPTVPGHIYPTVQQGLDALRSNGGDTVINLTVEGQPQRVESPADIVAELRRAARVGLVPRPRRTA